MHRYLFYIEQPYSFSILRPLQAEIRAQGGEVRWFLKGDKVQPASLAQDEVALNRVAEVQAYDPRAVFVPGNVVPDFFPGVKVQVFHGLEWKKKGHFRIRGFFDLYCTHGPITTERFRTLSQQHGGYFEVIETGWPKMDPYLGGAVHPLSSPPTVVYAPTFSPALTSVPDLFEPIKVLSEQGAFRFVVKFHPKMDPEWVARYRAIQGPNLVVSEEGDLLKVFGEGDLVLSDTSSAVTEALMMGKVVVTYRNSQPQPCLLDFDEADKLVSQLAQGLAPEPKLLAAIESYLDQVHPTLDGRASQRVLEAVEQVVAQGVRPKPWNILRKLKIRRALSYYRVF
ncbi:CDP-glycerol--glycerophosphate glycerophosphotransferase [Ferrimonas balearica]|uniref:CDP-glycerol--glycerophosphate glycerophosphotransferase n=1 Tax=Ferrimonas balearica TaxID=44012 RepID=UPI001C98E61F|nr:CDP-glycerol--glycerophosphate glycerophosphotransferase [Ferrimonas balearica]MBY5923348.1 CDP-glycerol--glycerophosphate glycerophosphotransferase [Ferrimonas balearica]MBY5995306.1 CDP-glycerol--glycerophosphate glycerophosphotransferase [Ferrimonas balearica]